MDVRMNWMIGGATASLLIAGVAIQSTAQPAGQPAACPRFPAQASTAFKQGVAALPWRTDFPADAPVVIHPWEQVDFRTEWRAYMAAVLSELQASGLAIQNNRIEMAPGAEWWIAPWMDYGTNGREALLGLTKERGPDAGDLSPASTRGPQVWAIGFYNREGAKGLHDIYLDPCNPARPAMGWTFPARTMSFKLLFTDAPTSEVSYLTGAPTVEALIDPPGSSSNFHLVKNRTRQTLRLIQVDIAVRDPRAPLGWLFGTFVWQNNQSGLYGDLTPVGLIWGNDPGADADPLKDFATLSSTRLNDELAEIVWQGQSPWRERPWPGFQGRLNGPADNLRSSCMSCHALAQWPRSPALGIVPRPANRYTLAALADPARRAELRANWMRDVQGGALTEPGEAAATPTWGGATPLDYSLQLEASFSRLCDACSDGVLTGATPAVCRVAGVRSRVTTASCPPPSPGNLFGAIPARESEPPRQ